FNLPPAKNPIDRLSGDQNTEVAPSVAGICRASRVVRGRNQILLRPDGSVATNTSSEPSGERAMPVVSILAQTSADHGPAPKAVPGGGDIVNLTTFACSPIGTFERSRATPTIDAETRATIATTVGSGRVLIERNRESRVCDSTCAASELFPTVADAGASSEIG